MHLYQSGTQLDYCVLERYYSPVLVRCSVRLLCTGKVLCTLYRSGTQLDYCVLERYYAPVQVRYTVRLLCIGKVLCSCTSQIHSQITLYWKGIMHLYQSGTQLDYFVLERYYTPVQVRYTVRLLCTGKVLRSCTSQVHSQITVYLKKYYTPVLVRYTVRLLCSYKGIMHLYQSGTQLDYCVLIKVLCTCTSQIHSQITVFL